MTPRQRIEGILAVLGFTYEKPSRSEGPRWTHPHCPAIDSEAIGQPGLETEADLVKHLHTQGFKLGVKHVQMELTRLIGLQYGFPRA